MNDERQNPIISRSESEDFPLSVALHADGTFSIEWDEHDPTTAIFNNFTHEDFMGLLRTALENDITVTVTEAVEEAVAE